MVHATGAAITSSPFQLFLSSVHQNSTIQHKQQA